LRCCGPFQTTGKRYMDKKRLSPVLGLSLLCLALGCGQAQKMARERAEKMEAARVLIAELRSPDPIVSLDAETKLKAMGADAIPALAEFVNGDATKGKRRAIRIIGNVGGEPAAQALVEILLDVGPTLKSDVLATLNRLGTVAAPFLVEAIPDVDDTALQDVQTCMLLVGNKEAIDQIIENLHSHLKTKYKEKDAAKVQRLRHNTVSVLRAMTARSFSFDKNAPEEEQRAALVKWVQWWPRNRDALKLHE